MITERGGIPLITQAEVQALFGPHMPVDVAKILHDPSLDIIEARRAMYSAASQGLTYKQRALYLRLKDLPRSRWPQLKQLAYEFGVSDSMICKRVNSLRKRGLLL